MLTAIVAFYSPCGYELPKRHLAATLAWLERQRVNTIVAQVVRSGQLPQPVPGLMQSLVYETDHVLFFKENLWNLAARQADGDALLFVDADIIFSVDDVAGVTSQLLEAYDVVQPYEVAHWLDREGLQTPVMRRSTAAAIANGVEPKTSEFHPGFAWAMTRDAFGRIGGFYDRHPFGGADTAFAYSLHPRWIVNRVAKWVPAEAVFWESPSFVAYQQNAATLGLRVGYPQGVHAMHRWHGDIQNRGYTTRSYRFPLQAGSEYPLEYRRDGLLQWANDANNKMLADYFASRREDG